MDILEKVKLAEEVGLANWAAKKKEEIAVEDQIKKLTQMRFKITNKKRIESQITRRYWDFRGAFDSAINSPQLWISYFLTLGGAFLFRAYKLTWVEVMNLTNWTDNLPYGALLAVKEAKEAGMKRFEIHFPVTEARARRKADPVIVGFMGESKVEARIGMFDFSGLLGIPREEMQGTGPMIEVFAWDDGKVYE